jgi:hypothetical protein
MEFMFLIVDRKGARTGEPVTMAEMGKFAGELAQQGKLKGGAPLHPESAGVRVEVRDGKTIVTDGPFAESKEAIAGSFIVDAASRAEAIEIAKRCPHARAGIVEVRALPDRDVVKPGHTTAARFERQPTQFMFLLRAEPGESDPDGSKYREMVAYDVVLKREGIYVESSQLARDTAARVEAQGGPPLVSDGPFAETKEVAAGYYVVEAADRAQALEIAKRCPHAKWGSIELREVVKIGPM